jgi:dUTPase
MGVLGPLPPGTWGLLLGQRSIIIKGLQIFPGVIDNDYAGEIKIMAASTHDIIIVPANLKILIEEKGLWRINRHWS